MNDIQKMNMQKTIDNIVNEFRQMLENKLLPTESTKFLCIDTDGEVAILDSKQIPAGTLIGGDCWEAFRVLVFGDGDDEKPWVLNTGLKMSYGTFAQTMRSRRTLPRVIYWSLSSSNVPEKLLKGQIQVRVP